MKRVLTTVLTRIEKSIRLLLLSNPNTHYFIYSALLSAVVTILTLCSLGLLFPLVHGIITGSFVSVQQLPVIRTLFEVLPMWSQTSAGTFLILVIVLYIITVIKNILHYYTHVYVQTQAHQAAITLRNRVFEVCMTLDKHFYDAHPIASVHHMFAKLPAVLEAQFQMVQRCLTQCVLVVAYISIMLYVSWQLALIVLFVFPVMWWLTYRLVARIQQSAHAADRWSLHMSSQVLNTLLCMPIIRGFAKESHEIKRFIEANDREMTEVYNVKKITSLVAPLEEVSITTAALVVAGGMAALIHAGTVPQATWLFMFFYLALHVLRSVSVFNSFRVQVAQMEPVVLQVQEILTAPLAHIVHEGVMTMPAITSGITIQHLSFTYPHAHKAVLTDVSFTIPKGKVVALVGLTGSGKSTLTNLLLRLYDCPPETIFVDGVDIRTYTTASIRNRCSFVYQDALLFNTSVQENMTYGSDGDVHPTTVSDTVATLGLTDMVAGIDGGLQGSVGDRASNISGGQKKIITLVRALLREHEFLILDEATNALDVVTERAVLDALFADVRAHQKTVLLISHRLSTIKHADTIVFLEHGTIVESGTYDELIALQGKFFKHWRPHHPDQKSKQ